MATKQFSPAQIAAQKLFAERARAGTLKKGKRKANPGKALQQYTVFHRGTSNVAGTVRETSPKAAKEKIANRLGIPTLAYLVARKGERLENPGLYDNINAKRARIRAGSGERMRKPGEPGRPTAQAFIDSAKTAKRNPITETLIYGLPRGETRDYMEDLMYAGGQKLTQAQIDSVLKAASDAGFHSFRVTGFDPTVRPDFAAAVKPLRRKRNPDKAKPRAYVKRVSQATGAPPSKRLMTRRKMALKAPAGYFPNPGTGMMTGYQVICMHPKKHVVGIFKTMAQAKQIATAMANANNVAYAVKAVKVHKAHFAA